MMWARKVSRSTTAAASLGSSKVRPHSEKGALEATATEARSSRSVRIWKSRSVARGLKAHEAEFVEGPLAAYA